MNETGIQMNIFLKIVGYILLASCSVEIVYIIMGQPFARQVHDVQDILWRLVSAVGLLALGIYLVIRKPETVSVTNSKSRGFGVASLVIGIIGFFWWPAVLGILAVVLAILQFRRLTSKLAIAGLCLGTIDYISASIWYALGLSPSIF